MILAFGNIYFSTLTSVTICLKGPPNTPFWNNEEVTSRQSLFSLNTMHAFEVHQLPQIS